MLFKSIYGSCSFWFNGIRYNIDDTINTDDAKLIEYLTNNPNFIRLEQKLEEEPKKVKKGGNNG